MKIEFITEPDCTGKGLVIVDGRYYGLPLEAVLRIMDWRAIACSHSRLGEYVCPECRAKNSEWVYPGEAKA